MTIFKKMKKTFFSLLVFFSLLTVACGLIDIDNNDTTVIAAPSISIATEGHVISPTIVTGTSYMSIFRYRVTDASNSATIVADTTVLIGQITPAENYTGSVQFTDYYTASGEFYQYYIRYKTSHTYSYSSASGTYPGNGNPGTKPITGTAPLDILYTDSQYILSFTSSMINMPSPKDSADTFDLMVGLNNGISTLLFPFTFDNANSKYTMALRNVLPTDFLNTPLSMSCIVGQTDEDVVKGSNDNTVIYTTYHWSSSLKSEIVNSSGDVLAKITIPSDLSSSDISDFTPSPYRINFSAE